MKSLTVSAYYYLLLFLFIATIMFSFGKQDVSSENTNISIAAIETSNN